MHDNRLTCAISTYRLAEETRAHLCNNSNAVTRPHTITIHVLAQQLTNGEHGREGLWPFCSQEEEYQKCCLAIFLLQTLNNCSSMVFSVYSWQ